MVFTVSGKLASWWLTNEDANSAELMSSVKTRIKEYQRKGYLTAVFRSGSGDLEHHTRQLLKNNSSI